MTSSMYIVAGLCLVFLWSSEAIPRSSDKRTSDPRVYNRRPQSSSACSFAGSLQNHGDTFVVSNNPCIKYQCNSGQVYSIETKCLDGHNRCHAVGATMRGGFNGCLLMQCQADGNFQHVQSDPYKCKDINNICRRPNIDRFPYNVNGFHVNNCLCKIVAGEVKYYCPPVGRK